MILFCNRAPFTRKQTLCLRLKGSAKITFGPKQRYVFHSIHFMLLLKYQLGIWVSWSEIYNRLTFIGLRFRSVKTVVGCSPWIKPGFLKGGLSGWKWHCAHIVAEMGNFDNFTICGLQIPECWSWAEKFQVLELFERSVLIGRMMINCLPIFQ